MNKNDALKKTLSDEFRIWNEDAGHFNIEDLIQVFTIEYND